LTSGDPAAAQRVGVRLAAAAQAATNPSAQDQATARLGLRLYAEAAGKPPEAPRVDLTS
jgi:hypothetical protein